MVSPVDPASRKDNSELSTDTVIDWRLLAGANPFARTVVLGKYVASQWLIRPIDTPLAMS
jgi:hypothetical protein